MLIPPTQTAGSYVGWLAIATTRPVVGLEHHHGARVGLVVAAGHVVVGRPGGLDRLGELALDDALHLGVDRGDEGVAGLAGHLAVVAEHPAHRVDGDGAVAGHPAQPPVVLLLDTRPGPRPRRR